MCFAFTVPMNKNKTHRFRRELISGAFTKGVFLADRIGVSSETKIFKMYVCHNVFSDLARNASIHELREFKGKRSGANQLGSFAPSSSNVVQTSNYKAQKQSTHVKFPCPRGPGDFKV